MHLTQHYPIVTDDTGTECQAVIFHPFGLKETNLIIKSVDIIYIQPDFDISDLIVQIQFSCFFVFKKNQIKKDNEVVLSLQGNVWLRYLKRDEMRKDLRAIRLPFQSNCDPTNFELNFKTRGHGFKFISGLKIQYVIPNYSSVCFKSSKNYLKSFEIWGLKQTVTDLKHVQKHTGLFIGTTT